MTKSIYRQVYFDKEARTNFWVYSEERNKLEQQENRGGYFYQIAEDSSLRGPFHTREAALGAVSWDFEQERSA